jgi:hypothetical protein
MPLFQTKSCGQPRHRLGFVDLIVRNQQIPPRLAVVGGGVLAPEDRGSCLLLHGFVGNSPTPLWFTQITRGFRFHHEVGFVFSVLAVMNLEIALGGLEPFQDVAVVF